MRELSIYNGHIGIAERARHPVEHRLVQSEIFAFVRTTVQTIIVKHALSIRAAAAAQRHNFTLVFLRDYRISLHKQKSASLGSCEHICSARGTGLFARYCVKLARSSTETTTSLVCLVSDGNHSSSGAQQFWRIRDKQCEEMPRSACLRHVRTALTKQCADCNAPKPKQICTRLPNNALCAPR